jgi:hypothetical protein
MKPQEKQNRGKTKNQKTPKKKLKICATRETVHLREEVTRTASLEVSKAWEKEEKEEEEEQADQGEEQDPILPAIAQSRETQREREREFTEAPKIHNLKKKLWLILAILWEKLLLFKEKNVLAKFPYCLEKTNIPRKRGKKKLPENCQFFF